MQDTGADGDGLLRQLADATPQGHARTVRPVCAAGSEAVRLRPRQTALCRGRVGDERRDRLPDSQPVQEGGAGDGDAGRVQRRAGPEVLRTDAAGPAPARPHARPLAGRPRRHRHLVRRGMDMTHAAPDVTARFTPEAAARFADYLAHARAALDGCDELSPDDVED